MSVAERDRPLPHGHSGPAFDAPLSEERAAQLVEALRVAPGGHVLALACGRSELLLRVVAGNAGTTGTGVDRRRAALEHARAEVVRRGLQERVELVEDDFTQFGDRGDVVLAVNAARAWPDLTSALRAFRGHVEDGGTLLHGDRFWARPPGAVPRETFGDLPTWDGLLATARSSGFTVAHADRSTPGEWEAYEEALRAEIEASHGAEAVQQHLVYERTYRGTLGFAWLQLAVGA